MTSDLILATLSLGLGVAASHRIGNLLGADKPANAKFASRIPYLLSALIGLLEFFAIMAARNVYGYIFSDDDDVVELAAQVLPLMAGFQVLDLANGGAGGILRGAGKTHQSGICNFVAYYGVGLTTSWYLGFRLEMGLFGLWSGIITGSFALLIFQTFFVGRIDWQRESELITERSGC
jgi:MATE family multidrug resistance protein